MPDKPLQPFTPSAAFNTLHASGITSDALFKWLLCLVFVFWAIYTLVAIYHWLKYSHASWVAVPAIGLHLVVSFALIFYVLSGAL